MSRIRFAYLSSNDPRDKKVWSGTHFSIFSSLQKTGEVVVLGPYEPAATLLFLRLLNQLCLKLFKKRFDYRHSRMLGKAYGRYFSARLRKQNFDFVVAPAASCELAYLETSIPVIYITDGTFASCLNYHKSLSQLTAWSVKQGHEIEKRAIMKSRLLIVSSEWAARSAIQDYGADPAKVLNLPYGANFELVPSVKEIEFRAPEDWNLLFVGVYWESKGGEYAFNCFKLLYDKGYPVRFTVLGCVPPSHIKHPAMTVVPFLDKNHAHGRKKLYDIFMKHHWLILPTRFDCTPIVINEASAFAIPSVVADTGGIRGHLKEGMNGFAVDYHDRGEGYAKVIEKHILVPALYETLRKSSREIYEASLNWEAWTAAFKKTLQLP